jgi:hypothetical protein
MTRGTMRIRIDLDATPLTATLDDTEVARDFAALLPLSLTLEDYASTEKISDLPRKLSTTGAPAGTDASVGDISYYAPWGNLAVFYRKSGYASGLVKIGTIDRDTEALSVAGPLTAKFELMEE